MRRVSDGLLSALLSNGRSAERRVVKFNCLRSRHSKWDYGWRSAAAFARAKFLYVGELTVCTMVPMHSVPHGVVCLLGLEDGTFPRTQTVDSDGVLAPRPG